MQKFKTGDKVQVTIGKDKGRTGTIEKVYPKENKAMISEVNIYKKHVKAMFAPNNKGGIYEIAKPLPFSKIALVCPSCKKITRVGFKGQGEKKVRVCRKCGKEITKALIKKSTKKIGKKSKKSSKKNEKKKGSKKK